MLRSFHNIFLTLAFAAFQFPTEKMYLLSSKMYQYPNVLSDYHFCLALHFPGSVKGLRLSSQPCHPSWKCSNTWTMFFYGAWLHSHAFVQRRLHIWSAGLLKMWSFWNFSLHRTWPSDPIFGPLFSLPCFVSIEQRLRLVSRWDVRMARIAWFRVCRCPIAQVPWVKSLSHGIHTWLPECRVE